MGGYAGTTAAASVRTESSVHGKPSLLTFVTDIVVHRQVSAYDIPEDLG